MQVIEIRIKVLEEKYLNTPTNMANLVSTFWN